MLLNLVSSSICKTGVRHRVSVVTIGNGLKEEWTILKSVVLGPLRDFPNHENIVPVVSNSRYNIPSGVEVRIG